MCDVHLRPYQPCYVYICMHESASLSTMKNKRNKTVGALCRKHASVQNMRSLHFALDKTVASCIQRSIDARHGAFYLRRDLLPRVVVCGSRARGTISCANASISNSCHQCCFDTQNFKHSVHNLFIAFLAALYIYPPVQAPISQAVSDAVLVQNVKTIHHTENEFL